MSYINQLLHKAAINMNPIPQSKYTFCITTCDLWEFKNHFNIFKDKDVARKCMKKGLKKIFFSVYFCSQIKIRDLLKNTKNIK